MVKLNIIGNIFGQSGYAVHTRSLLNALDKIGVELSYSGGFVDNWVQQVNDSELKILKREPFVNENILAVSLPSQWHINLCEPHKKFFGYCVFEGTKVPVFWIKYFLDNRVDYIIVPSEHTKLAILNTLESLKEK